MVKHAMLVSGKKLEHIFKKVRNIREHMQATCLASDRAKLSVEDLQWCIGDMYGLKISKSEVAFDAEYVFGMVERYKDRAHIYLRKDQPDDMMRFVCVKELCQIALDEQEDWSPVGTNTIETLVYEVVLDDLPPPVTQSEYWAEIAAIELVYPFVYREVDAADIKNGKTTPKSLALYFHIPEFVIGIACHPKYARIATIGWKLVQSG